MGPPLIGTTAPVGDVSTVKLDAVCSEILITGSAAEGAGGQSKARAMAAALRKLGSNADSQRDSLQQAKQLAGG